MAPASAVDDGRLSSRSSFLPVPSASSALKARLAAATTGVAAGRHWQATTTTLSRQRRGSRLAGLSELERARPTRKRVQSASSGSVQDEAFLSASLGEPSSFNASLSDVDFLERLSRETAALESGFSWQLPEAEAAPLLRPPRMPPASPAATPCVPCAANKRRVKKLPPRSTGFCSTLAEIAATLAGVDWRRRTGDDSAIVHSSRLVWNSLSEGRLDMREVIVELDVECGAFGRLLAEWTFAAVEWGPNEWKVLDIVHCTAPRAVASPKSAGSKPKSIDEWADVLRGSQAGASATALATTASTAASAAAAVAAAPARASMRGGAAAAAAAAAEAGPEAAALEMRLEPEEPARAPEEVEDAGPAAGSSSSSSSDATPLVELESPEECRGQQHAEEASSSAHDTDGQRSRVEAEDSTRRLARLVGGLSSAATALADVADCSPAVAAGLVRIAASAAAKANLAGVREPEVERLAAMAEGLAAATVALATSNPAAAVGTARMAASVAARLPPHLVADEASPAMERSEGACLVASEEVLGTPTVLVDELNPPAVPDAGSVVAPVVATQPSKSDDAEEDQLAASPEKLETNSSQAEATRLASIAGGLSSASAALAGSSPALAAGLARIAGAAAAEASFAPCELAAESKEEVKRLVALSEGLATATVVLAASAPAVSLGLARMAASVAARLPEQLLLAPAAQDSRFTDAAPRTAGQELASGA